MEGLLSQAELLKGLTWNQQVLIVLINTVTGTVAAGLVISFFYPLEYLETILQLGLTRDSSYFSLVKSQYYLGGVSQFYCGSIASILGHSFAWGFFFLCFETAKQVVGIKDPRSLVVFCSLVAGLVYVTVYVPFANLKTRVIRDKRFNNSIKGVLEEVVDSSLVSSLYSGYSVSLLYVLESIAQFIVYEEMKTYFVRSSGVILSGGSLGVLYLVMGFSSKFIAITITYPYRVLQTILQSGTTTLLVSVQKLLEEDGVLGFYRGYNVCLMRSLPPAGFMFMLLELLRNFCFSLIEFN